MKLDALRATFVQAMMEKQRLSSYSQCVITPMQRPVNAPHVELKLHLESKQLTVICVAG